MLNIILYILIASGIGYFIFLIYKKWSQIQKEDSPSIKFSKDSIKRMSQRLIAQIKQIFIKCRQLRIKNIFEKIKGINFSLIAKKFFKKGKIHRISTVVKKLKIKTRNGINIITNNLKKTVQRIAKIMKKDKFPKNSQDKPLFETKSLEKKETSFLEREEVSSRMPNNKKSNHFLSFIALKIEKRGRKIKISNFFSFIKKLKGKIKLKAIIILLKKLRRRTRIRFISEEDQKIKKQLNKTKEVIINSESYLGELLKKKEEDKTIPQKTETISFENNVVENFPDKLAKGKNIKIKKLKKLLKKFKNITTIKDKAIKVIKDMNKRKMEKKRALKQEKSAKIKKENELLLKEKIAERPKRIQENKQSLVSSKIEISQEAVKKIENKLISEILEDSKNIEAYKKLGKIYYNQDKYHYAAECFKAAIKLGSGDKRIKD